jgi:ABC-2 type transport system permease protein
MDKVGALLLASWRAARSYRLRLAMSIGALAISVLPMWYAASALQGLMADKIRGEGSQYPPFLIVGMIVYGLLMVMVNALPNALSGGIANGSLEALLATKIKTPELLLGMFSYDLCWALLRALVILVTAALLGARFAWDHALAAIPVLVLILLAYVPFGLMAAASVLAFRTAGPFPQIVLILSGLLGGAYFPTKVIPDMVQYVSKVVPLTYGLRSLRAVLLDGQSLVSVSRDITILIGMTLLLFATAILVLDVTLRHVRRGGGLSQY